MMYNVAHDITKERIVMPKDRIQPERESFGQRLARFRSEAGYSQRDLARETGISQRMIAHYEKQAQSLPIHILPLLAETLGVSTDELLGLKASKKNGKNKNTSLWRRLSRIEKLDTKEKRQIIQLIDTFIEKKQLEKKIQRR